MLLPWRFRDLAKKVYQKDLFSRRFVAHFGEMSKSLRTGSERQRNTICSDLKRCLFEPYKGCMTTSFIGR